MDYRGKFYPNGPGTELKKLLGSMGFKERKGCSCKKYARLMNVNGVDWCNNNLDTIVGWLKNNAKERRLPFSRIAAKQLVKQAIKRHTKIVGTNMNLRKYFDKVYCVNLDRRKDRWKKFKQQVPADWPFKEISRIQAIDGKKCPRPEWWTMGGGAWGCFRTHARIIEQAINNGHTSILIFEDDAQFVEGFTEKVTTFLEQVPDDWGMIYLGGQHLHVGQHPPKKVDGLDVYIPWNVNRTHAFALRGKTLKAVYKHLYKKDWHKGNHVDHHLGRFHQRRDPNHRIYTPKEWLVGQAAGQSNIAGKITPDRLWQPAEALAYDINDDILLAVVGLHSSGSTAMAGVLHHLGLHLGNQFIKGPWGTSYEAVALAKLCEAAYPAWESDGIKMPRHKAHSKLRNFVNEKRREAHKKGTIAAIKYPQLCRFGNSLIDIAGEQLRVLHIARPVDESIASLQRRCKKQSVTGDKLDAHQRWLEKGKTKLLNRVPSGEQLTVNYGDLVDSPEVEVQRVIDWLGIKPDRKQIQKAIDHIDEARRHINTKKQPTN